MTLSNQAVERVIDTGKWLVEAARSVPFAHVAKLIEQEQGCHIFIIPFEQSMPNVTCRCCVATSLSYVTMRAPGQDSRADQSEIVPVNHHFIFYKPQPEDPSIEKLSVAHGLAHCALHWPLGPRKDRLVTGTFHGIDMYLVNFTEEEEEEASALACILTASAPQL